MPATARDHFTRNSFLSSHYISWYLRCSTDSWAMIPICSVLWLWGKSTIRTNIDLLRSEKNIFINFLEKMTDFKTAAGLFEFTSESSVVVILPTFAEVAFRLAVIPATSCTAKRSVSALSRLGNYLRNTMLQN